MMKKRVLLLMLCMIMHKENVWGSEDDLNRLDLYTLSSQMVPIQHRIELEKNPEALIEIYKEYAPYFKVFLFKIGDTATPNEFKEGASIFYEIGFSSKAENIRHHDLMLASFYIEQFFISVEHATIPHDWSLAARIYCGLGRSSLDLELSLDYSKKSIFYWERYLQESKASKINNMDYANIAVAYNNAGFTSGDFGEKEEFYGKSAHFWDQYFISSQNRVHCLKERAFAYNNARFWAQSSEKKINLSKKALSFWNLFVKTQENLTEEDGAFSILVNQIACFYEPNLSKKNEYLKKIEDLEKTHKILGVYKLGEDILFFQAEEADAIQKQAPLILDLPEEIQEEAAEKEEKKSLIVIENKIIEEQISAQTIDTPTIDETTQKIKLTKSQRKNARKKTDTIQSITVKSQQQRTHQVSPLMVAQITKAYANPLKKKQALDILDEIIELKSLNTIKEDKVMKHLNKIEQYLLIQSFDKESDRSILGHSFDFHSAHGSRGGDWDKGMIHRLVRFARDIKITFETIMNQKA
jgi:hypothetical protein